MSFALFLEVNKDCRGLLSYANKRARRAKAGMIPASQKQKAAGVRRRGLSLMSKVG
jgi:hypothetical protein